MTSESNDSLPTTLVLTLDYELFFDRSGSVENCLLRPSAMLTDFAAKHGLRLTFYVDVGMIVWLERHAGKDRRFARIGDTIKRDVERIGCAGHEIGLHIHPHWEDTRWENDGWSFAGTRYQLGQFSPGEISDIVNVYSNCLADIANDEIESFRAGGFCVEPFDVLGPSLAANNIWIDSSVVPGAFLLDVAKGFDFRHAPSDEFWFFNASPLSPEADGSFCEIPLIGYRVPSGFYWKRMFHRLGGVSRFKIFGDGTSRKPGKLEIVRRLIGTRPIVELSIDEPKVATLREEARARQDRKVWSILGHPKLLSSRSLELLCQFKTERGIQRSCSVTEIARDVRSRRSAPPTAGRLGKQA